MKNPASSALLLYFSLHSEFHLSAESTNVSPWKLGHAPSYFFWIPVLHLWCLCIFSTGFLTDYKFISCLSSVPYTYISIECQQSWFLVCCLSPVEGLGSNECSYFRYCFLKISSFKTWASQLNPFGSVFC